MDDEVTVDDLVGEGDPSELQDIEVGDEVWIPASRVYETGCRAVKVRVVDRTSIGSFEDDNALTEWDTEADQ